MTGIDVELPVLKSFRDDLTNRSEDLKEHRSKSEQLLNDVAEKWKDEQFVKFKNGFEADKQDIQNLCNIMDGFVEESLNPLIQIIQGYIEL